MSIYLYVHSESPVPLIMCMGGVFLSPDGINELDYKISLKALF